MLFIMIHYQSLRMSNWDWWIMPMLRYRNVTHILWLIVIHKVTLGQVLPSTSEYFRSSEFSWSKFGYIKAIISLTYSVNNYSLTRIWWNFNWAEFLWINGNFSFEVPSYSGHTCIGRQGHNRRFKLNFEFGLGKGFALTRLIISIFHRLIGQYFESGILFISVANLHGEERWLDVWEIRS